ncbi:Flp pilus assembly protein TadB [Haloactinopolyspora alba]|uniref:Flp pilus assembly protein TadB n=1 Tax=Haloactinopolyspora alba TaxID=648780 RepID=A0A2P8DVY3_9ACTN|nr:type II secretion system F family protein [Haloactinopolyspora alba]PSL01379.1 Flp pilus assembly protein TadB [Haloactinopolyspora alba]
MSAFTAALSAMLILGGILLVAVGLVPRSALARPTTRTQRVKARFVSATGGRGQAARRTRKLLGVGLAVGMLGWLLTGWLILVLLAPVALIGLPVLLTPPSSSTSVAKLEAMEEWTRSLAGVLTVGVGIEQAIMATMKSTPEALRPEVTTLAARLRARWPTVAALRAFADDLDDATGDLIASSLILGATRRGSGLAAVLEGLASTVAQDVQVRRNIEADRSKPRTTARMVTIVTLVALGFMAFNSGYIEPYGTPVGQIVLIILLSCYVLCLLWMRQITRPQPLPRIMGWNLRASNRGSPARSEAS